MIDTAAPVVVAFRGAYGAVSIARTLGRLGVPAYLVAQEGKPSPVTASRYWSEQMSWDFDRAEEDSLGYLLDVGRRLGDRHGAKPVLLTLEDWVAVLLERNGEALKQEFLVPLPVQPVLRKLLHKWGMNELAQQHGIPIPTTVLPATGAEADEFLEAVGLPVVMKGADPFASDRPPTMIIRRREELFDEISRREAEGRALNMVLQEFIPGGIDSVWMCNGYFGSDPARDLTFPGRKLRQVSAAGVASLAVCEPNETVASQTRRLMQGAGYRGCCGIGWRYDQRDGKYKVLDINARVSGVFRLFVGTNDVDVVRACYLDLTGQELPPTELQPGRKWMLEDDIRSAMAEVRAGQLTLRDWARSLRGVRELHWWARDDPKPGMVWSRDRVRRVRSAALKRSARAV